MCGLVGAAGDTTGLVKDIFTDLLIIDSVRGMHSTGAAIVRRYKNEIAMAKQSGPSHNLIIHDDYKKMLQEFGLKCLIGHNRHATIGAHTLENAHPFAFDKIVGAHNGTLEHASRKKLHNNEKYGTDSQALFSNINEYGLKETVNNLAGAWALTWYDTTNNTINFLRNNKRPLYYTYSKDRCTLFWASEESMLEWALGRHHALSDNKHEIFYVEVDQHYSWHIPDAVNGKFQGPIKEEVKAPPPEPSFGTGYWVTEGGKQKWKQYGSYTYPHQQGGSQHNVVPFKGTAVTHTVTKVGGNKSTGESFKGKVDTAKFRPPYKDAYGRTINKKEFFKLVADGCVFCEDNSTSWGSFIKMFRDTDGHQVYLCEDCYNEDEILSLCQHLV